MICEGGNVFTDGGNGRSGRTHQYLILRKAIEDVCKRGGLADKLRVNGLLIVETFGVYWQQFNPHYWVVADLRRRAKSYWVLHHVG